MQSVHPGFCSFYRIVLVNLVLLSTFIYFCLVVVFATFFKGASYISGCQEPFPSLFFKVLSFQSFAIECSALDNIQVRRYYQPVYLKGLGSCVLFHTCIHFCSVMGSTVVNVTDSLCSCWSRLYSDVCTLDMTYCFNDR